MHPLILGLATILSIFAVSAVSEYFAERSVLGSLVGLIAAVSIAIVALRLGWVKFDFVTLATIFLLHHVGGVLGRSLPKRKRRGAPLI